MENIFKESINLIGKHEDIDDLDNIEIANAMKSYNKEEIQEISIETIETDNENNNIEELSIENNIENNEIENLTKDIENIDEIEEVKVESKFINKENEEKHGISRFNDILNGPDIDIDNKYIKNVIQFIFKNTILSVKNNFESKIYTTEFKNNLIDKYTIGPENVNKELFKALIQELIDENYQDDYLKEMTKNILVYILN